VFSHRHPGVDGGADAADLHFSHQPAVRHDHGLGDADDRSGHLHHSENRGAGGRNGAQFLRFGRTRTNVGFDVYNVTNAAPVLTYNQNFVPNGAWLVPTSVLQPRFVKFSAQLDF
jgi:hypothetical protein